MRTAFARRMAEVRASDIRELLRYTQRPEMISLAGGLPAPELFPCELLAAAAQRLLREQGPVALQYSTTEGHPPLRERIAARLNAKWGTRLAAEHVLVTTGSQQGLDLLGKLFLDEGDEVVCESPTYIGAITAWRVFQPRWVEVPTDDEGMLPDALDARLARCRRPRFIYIVPNFQNPTGRTWSLERRARLMEVAGRHDVPIVEDNPYGELRFAGESLPAVQSLPGGERVISLGTFSKILSPGLRVGWIASARPFVEKLTILKQGADLHTATLSQMLVDACLADEAFEANVRLTAQVYAARCAALLAALEREMPPGVRFTRPQGGLFLWLELPEHVSARDLLPLCLERNVAFVPGGGFFPNGGGEHTLRLNFSCMAEARLVEGAKRLAGALRELLARAPAPAGAGAPAGEGGR